ncbi:hypothetical protein F2P47_05420 [Parvibaculum sedimenti]|uniref:Uncharacterized protein n=1 Tax=Parvibaculum sedimenti TaxID=2608632 RepID=A0A6N6VJC5_9HYPH|nr:hypothetical protein [Parvibaculum sedimenti]KAB7741187.1 hypothetical protein F2P47_05420 [Parvibaculum sedimenti]
MNQFGKLTLMLAVASVTGLGTLSLGSSAARADDDDYYRPRVQCDWDGDDCRYVQPERTVRTECDRDGDDCRQLVCDEDGDRCRPMAERQERYAYHHRGWW